MNLGLDVGGAFPDLQRVAAILVNFQQLRAIEVAQRQQTAVRSGPGAHRAARDQPVQRTRFAGMLQQQRRARLVNLQTLQYGCNGVAALDARFAPVGFAGGVDDGQRGQHQLLDHVFARHGVGHRVGSNAERRHHADKRQNQREQHAACRTALKPARKFLR